MKAVIQTSYGGPELMEMITTSKPTIKDDEVLIKIHATNVASGDWRINTLTAPALLIPILRLVFGCSGPRHTIRGITAAGTISEIGSKVSSSYQKGDRVYFINTMKAGCLAEYIALQESNAIMAKIPENMSFVDAAPLAFGGLSAYHFINENTIQKDDKVLIYGASGSVGTYAVQLAKYYGAQVTAVASAKHHQALLNLGVSEDSIIDYNEQDFRTQQNCEYDFILDAVGKITKQSCKSVLSKGGTYCTVNTPTKEDSNRLRSINKIVEEGKMETVIDKIYPFEEFKEAHVHTYGGHKSGNVVIRISEEES